jgi:predicted RNA-binding protein with PIN domain
MLDWLAQVHGLSAGDVWIIFDAHNVSHSSPDEIYRNLNIGFSHQQTADDRIEAILASETQPADLAVISNDTRIQKAARRKGCQMWTCQRYMDWLIDSESRSPKIPPAREEPEKEESATDEEMAEWLRVFEEPKKKRGRRQS